MHESTLIFEYGSSDRAAIVERSVAQEVGEISGDRTAARIERVGRTLTLTIDAADLVALRAGHNTWLSLVEVAERTAALDG